MPKVLNTTLGTDCGTHYTSVSLIAQAGFVIFILVLDLCGNSLVCLAICRYRRLRNVTNYLIGSLAVSDLLVACLSMPFRIYHTLKAMCWDLGPEVCDFWIFVDALCSGASICNLSVIAIDRYLTLSSPFTYPGRMRKSRGIAAITLVWLYSFIIASLSLTGPWSPDGFDKHFPACVKADKYYYALAITLSFFLPMVVLVIAYSKVFVVARKQARLVRETKVTQYGDIQVAESRSETSSYKLTSASKKRCRPHRRKSIVRELKATKTLAIVVGTFLVSWTPFFVIMLVVQFCPQCNQMLPDKAQVAVGTIFVYVLPLLNSAVNPIIYSRFNSEFRIAFKDILLNMLKFQLRRS